MPHTWRLNNQMDFLSPSPRNECLNVELKSPCLKSILLLADQEVTNSFIFLEFFLCADTLSTCSVGTVCMPSACGGQKRVIDLLILDSWMVVRNRSQVLCKSSKPLNHHHLSSPISLTS